MNPSTSDILVNVLDVVMGNYAEIDIISMLNMKCVCKVSRDFIASMEKIQLFSISDENEFIPITWLAQKKWCVKNGKTQKTIHELIDLREKIRNGDIQLMQSLLDDGDMFQDSHKFKTVINMCFDFKGVITSTGSKLAAEVETLHMMFHNIMKKCISDMESMVMNAYDEEEFMNAEITYDMYIAKKETRYKKYAQYIEIISKILEFTLQNINIIRNAKGYSLKIPIFSNRRIFYVLKNKNLTFVDYYRDLHDITLKTYFKRTLEYNIKLCNGWIEAFFHNKDVRVGAKRGIYILNATKNTKTYIKANK